MMIGYAFIAIGCVGLLVAGVSSIVILVQRFREQEQ